MADPLSIIGAIAAITQISSAVVDIIKAVKDASSERQKLLAEINGTTALCQVLSNYAKNDAQPWTKTFQSLCESGIGPIDQFQSSLQYLQDKLATGQHGLSQSSLKGSQTLSGKRYLKSWAQSLKWPFTKDEVHKVLADIERQRSLFGIALANDNLQLSIAIRDEVSKVSKGVDALHIYQEDEKRKASLTGLSTIDFEATHGDIASQRAQGTGQWLLQSEEFNFWLQASPSSTLWCRGIPGSGKTVLTSLVLDDLRSWSGSISTMGVAGVYCSYRDPQANTAIWGSLLQQLAWPLVEIPPSVSEIESAASTNSVFQALLDVALLYEQVFVIIDALDECASRVTLLQQLQKLVETVSNAGTNIRVLITSRAGILDIEHNIEADAVYEIRSNDNDVRLYLEKSLRGQERLSRWMMDDPDLEASITEAILPQLSGMFLLARLYVDLLAEERTKRGVHRSLKKLPKGVDNTYAEAWNRICNQKAQQADIGRKVLLWVIYASRPLRWQELQYGLAIEEGDTQVESDGLLEIDDLTSFCAGLVVIDTQRDQVSLVHPTTNEYFEERKHLLFPAGDDTIAAACITHLLMDTFKTEGVCSEPDSFDRRWRQNPFLGYAAVCWGSHVRKAATNTGSDLSLRLLRDESARSAAVQVLTLNALGVSSVYYLSEWPPLIDADVRMTLGPKITRSRFRNSRKYIGALHLAAYFGLVSVVEGLLDSQSAVNEPDEMGATALHWAILGNQNVMLNLLLERGANVRACASKLVLRRWASDRRGTFSLPLHIASALGNTTAIETLLEHQAEINRVSLGTTALDAAIKMDQLAAARTLRAHGAGVNIGATPIDEAIRGGLDTVKLLIDGGLSSNLLHEALYRAASLRELSSMALILDAGANPDGSDTSSLEHPYDDSDASSTDEKLPCKDEDKRSKNTNGGEETVSEDGIKASESMNLYETYRSGSLAEVPLIESLAEWPVQRSEATRCCILLINAGADVNRIGRRQYIYRDDWQLSNPWGDIILPRGRKTTPLHTAAYFGELDAARELVQAGANINLSLGEQYTPLTSALHREGYIHHSDNPLTASSSLRARAMLQLLVDLGADPGLCTAHDRARIEKLLSLSPDDCEYLRALQSVVAVEYLETPSKRSFRDRIHALREILHKGANPELCCQKEQKIIEDFLSLSEEEVDEFDNARQRKLAERDLWVVGIW